jgi:hypothetical protein
MNNAHGFLTASRIVMRFCKSIATTYYHNVGPLHVVRENGLQMFQHPLATVLYVGRNLQPSGKSERGQFFATGFEKQLKNRQVQKQLTVVKNNRGFHSQYTVSLAYCSLTKITQY